MTQVFGRIATAAAAGLLVLSMAGTAHAATATGTTSVGIHNAYTPEKFGAFADALDSGAGMLEIDVWTNFLGTKDFQVGHNPGNTNNCAAASNYDQLRTGAKNQNLETCLRNIKLWHDRNPDHNLITLKVEFKNGFDGRGGFGPDRFDTLLDSTIGASSIFGPAQLLGGHGTLDEAARAGAWPAHSSLKGKFLVLVERGTFEAANPFDRYHTDVEYADRLISAKAAGMLGSALAFPAINGATQNDPRTGDRGGQRAGWFVAFDGGASAYAGFPGGAYLGGHYLVVMTDAHSVPPVIDSQNPSTSDAQARVKLLAGKGATIVSSDWTKREIVSYTTTTPSAR